MIWVAAALTTVLASLWGYTLVRIYQMHKPAMIPMRGMIKNYTYNIVPEESRPLIRYWFIISWAFTFSAWLLVIAITLHTDYNFWIGIFPFLWYYIFFRFYFWEKSDLSDEPRKESH